MKAYIIPQENFEQLLEKLELEHFKCQQFNHPVDYVFRHFNYIIRVWLDEQSK